MLFTSLIKESCTIIVLRKLCLR